MVQQAVETWQRPYFEAGEQRTNIVFVCFGKAPLADVPLSRSRFGLPGVDMANQVQLGEQLRSQNQTWFENWWVDAFGAIARRDLGDDLSLLTTSDVCYTLKVDLPDQPDLAPQQTIWALSRWLCARGASVVLDVHAFRFRTSAQVDELSFETADVLRDVKLVLETEATQGDLHLFHTRGLCKFARPELMCFVRPDDASLVGRALNQMAQRFMEGSSPSQVRLKLPAGAELVTAPQPDRRLIESLGLQAAVSLVRADGAPLAGIGRIDLEA
jgi:hypothetical protein